MKPLKSLSGYIKGRQSEELDESVDEEGGDNQVEMFSSSYWFGEKETDNVQNDPILPNLSKTQRITGFVMCLFLGLICFVVAGLTAPLLVLRLRKFILLYTMGSFFTIGSFSMLWGPVNHAKHICSYGRLPFTLAYFGALSATLYSATVLKSTPITLFFASLQMVALLWYVTSYIPGGTTGLKFFAKLFASACTKTVSKSLPI